MLATKIFGNSRTLTSISLDSRFVAILTGVLCDATQCSASWPLSLATALQLAHHFFVCCFSRAMHHCMWQVMAAICRAALYLTRVHKLTHAQNTNKLTSTKFNGFTIYVKLVFFLGLQYLQRHKGLQEA